MPYDKYAVRIAFRERGVAGSLPMTQGLASRYAGLLASGQSNDLKKAMDEEGVVSEEAIEKYLENCTAVFRVDEQGQVYLEDYQIIGLLRAAATLSKLTVKRKGTKGTLTKGGVFLRPIKLALQGGHLSKDEKPMQVSGKDGKHGTIKIWQTYTGAEPLEFDLFVLDNGDLPEEDVRTLLELGQEIGLGGSRPVGYGKYDLLSFKKAKANGK